LANCKSNIGVSPLHRAANHGALDILKLLLTDKQISLSEVDNNGNNVLHYSCFTKKDNHRVVEHILKLPEGSSLLEQKNTADCTPVYYAMLSRNLNLLKFLLEANNELIHTNETEACYSLLQLAIVFKYEVMIKFLFDKQGFFKHTIDDLVNFSKTESITNLLKTLASK
jgi:ankyrin repeat protein